MTRKTCFCALLLLITHFSIAQTTVKGKITDALTGEAISAVSVGTTGQSRSTISNEQGEFILPVERLPATLNFTHISYERYSTVANNEALIIRLTPAKTVLDVVSVNAPSAAQLLQTAWRKAGSNSGRNYYAKAFYRQLTTVNDTAKEIHELFYDLKWQVNRINGWRARESRYARTDTANDIPVYNPSYLAFLFSGYLFKFSNAVSPDSASISKNYDLRIEKYIEQADQRIAVISCKVKQLQRRQSSVYVDATYYVGMEDSNIYKIESAVYNVPFVDRGVRSKLTSVAVFAKKGLAFPVLDNLETMLEVPYRTGKKPQLIRIKSLINVYEQAENTDAGNYIATTEFVVDKNEVKRRPYNPEFWLGNPVVQHTPLESAFLTMLESKRAFGTMSARQSDVIADVKDPAFKLFFEKPYLHTDREVYTTGENLWFKAYLVNAQTNMLFNSSHNLYVELIDPGANIVSNKLVRLDKGTGPGDFYLPDSLPSGNYRLRAYTSWLRNFSDNFFFEKSVYIHGDTRKDGQTYNNSRAGTQVSPRLSASPVADVVKKTIRFFPEGGAMIENVQGRIAIKIEDDFGRGYAATGEIRNSSGELITGITCNETGMGVVTLQAVTGENYTASVELTNGETIRGQLPRPLLTGFSLTIRATDSLVRILVNTNEATRRETLILQATCKGRVVYSTPVAMTELRTEIMIAANQLGEGVNSIVVYDSSGKPQSERLIYLPGHNSGRIELHTDEASYSPKGKVTIRLKAQDQDKRPLPAKLSVAAVDAALSPVAQKDIVSYLQLQSEIRGEIENPRQYFDENNANRKQQLDVLLLTQGWRDFVWKRVADSALRLSYPVEQGIDITGRVRQVRNDTPMPNLNITLFATTFDDQKLYAAKTGADGKFNIENLEFYGYHYLNLNSRDAKGKKAGLLLVDSLFFSSPAVNPRLPSPAPALESTLAKSLSERKAALKQIRLGDTIALSEVNIARRGFKPIEPQRLFTVTVEDYKYQDLMQFLMSKEPGIRIVRDGPNEFCLYFQSIILGFGKYANGDPVKVPGYRYVPINAYNHVDMRQILTVTLTKYNDGFGPGLRFDLVLKPDAMVKPQYDRAMADVTGYSRARTFYAPKYERPNGKIDLRTTIHWDPSVVTDQNGEATVSYYNASPKTKVRVVVEGVSLNGLPLAGEVVYEVK